MTAFTDLNPKESIRLSLMYAGYGYPSNNTLNVIDIVSACAEFFEYYGNKIYIANKFTSLYPRLDVYGYPDQPVWIYSETA